MRFLLLSLLVGRLLCADAWGAELKKVRLLTDWYPQPEHGGFYHALLQGHYREAGLEVEILPGGPNAFVLPRVATGQAEFGMSTSEDVLLARQRGVPVVAVGATMQHDPQGIMVHEGSPIRRFEDLEGQTIAVTPGAAWFTYLNRRYGFKSVKERPLTYSVATFLRDTNYITQCFVTSEPFFVQQAGGKSRVLLLRDTGYDPYRVFLTHERYLRENPSIVRAFVTASVRGWKGYLENPDAVHAELQKRNPELSAEKMAYSWKALKEGRFVDGDPDRGEAVGQMTEARWRAQWEVLRDLKLVSADSDPTRGFTTEFLPTVP